MLRIYGYGRNHLVRAPRKPQQHADRILTIFGLAQHLILEDDDRIRSKKYGCLNARGAGGLL